MGPEVRDAFRLRTKYTLNTHVHTCIYGEKILSHHLPSLYVGLVYPIVMGVPRRPHALRSRAKDARQWISYAVFPVEDATSNHPESCSRDPPWTRCGISGPREFHELESNVVQVPTLSPIWSLYGKAERKPKC